MRALLDRWTIATTALVDPAPLLHGLYWLVSNLADQQPTLLVLDDLHRSDPETLRWACYLLRRLEGLGVAVLMATRPWSSTGSEAERLLTHLAALPATTRCHLRPLSDAGIHELLFITHKTVEVHLSNAYRKLQISSRTDLPAAQADTAPTADR